MKNELQSQSGPTLGLRLQTFLGRRPTTEQAEEWLLGELAIEHKGDLIGTEMAPEYPKAPMSSLLRLRLGQHLLTDEIHWSDLLEFRHFLLACHPDERQLLDAVLARLKALGFNEATERFERQ